MSMYERFAKDLSKELFDSVYGDLYKIATILNKEVYAAAVKAKKKYYPTDATEVLGDFCYGKISLGEALDYIHLNKSLV